MPLSRKNAQSTLSRSTRFLPHHIAAQQGKIHQTVWIGTSNPDLALFVMHIIVELKIAIRGMTDKATPPRPEP